MCRNADDCFSANRTYCGKCGSSANLLALTYVKVTCMALFQERVEKRVKVEPEVMLLLGWP